MTSTTRPSATAQVLVVVHAAPLNPADLKEGATP